MAAQIAEGQGNLVADKKIDCKARIGRSYLLHPRMHVRAAIEMGLHTAARSTGLQHLVDQQLHGVSAIALRLRAKGDIPFPRFGQQKMVHTANARHPVKQAGGHATSQHRSEDHTSELQSPMRISYAVFCLKKQTTTHTLTTRTDPSTSNS